MHKILLLVLSLLFTTSAFAHGMSDADKQQILDAGNLEYLTLGAKHMLTGYDHLLFLFGVIFFLTRFKDILKFITAFTVGHCITLIFATFLQIKANFYLIDAVIAVTVIYKGFDNLDGFRKYLNSKSPSLVWMVFAFGLIHGFGLSTRLQQLPLGDSGAGLIARILSFNVGVEVGQVIALSIMMVLLSSWRKTASFAKFGTAANSGLIFLGMALLVMQLHGYQHSRFSDDFPLNKDDHYHIHQEAEMLAKPSALEAESPSKPSALEDYQKKITVAPKPHSHGDGKAHTH